MNIRVRRFSFVMIVVYAVVVFNMSLGIAASPPPQPGKDCLKAGIIKTYKGKKYTCIKSGKKLIWNKGVIVANKQSTPTPTPSPTSTPTPTPAPTPTPTPATAPLVLSWDFKSEISLIPGTLVDGSPTEIQDKNLNSSFVVRVTREGLPASNVEITWVSTDETSKILPFEANTDSSGLARIWYFAGSGMNQSLEVYASKESSNKLKIALTRAPILNKTVGRYVSTYFSAPGYTDPKTNYDAFEITAIPKTSPINTYYQLITTWQKANPGETAFYGGVQQANCDVAASLYPSQVCEKSRGDLVGRLALFSAWDSPTKSGPKAPRVASLGPNARCVPFSHEGSGQSCSQPLDWKVNEKVTWRVDVLGEIIPGFVRVRSSVAIGNSSIFTEVATLDLPDEPNLTTISPFVEEWGGNESSNCLDVQLRELEILSINFLLKGVGHKPIYGVALGGLYSDRSTRCQNYSITTSGTGINIKSGGKNHWVDLKPVISWNSRSLPLKLGYVDENQTLWPWQVVDVTPLRK